VQNSKRNAELLYYEIGRDEIPEIDRLVFHTLYTEIGTMEEKKLEERS
jgi:hypothetical protein